MMRAWRTAAAVALDQDQSWAQADDITPGQDHSPSPTGKGGASAAPCLANMDKKSFPSVHLQQYAAISLAIRSRASLFLLPSNCRSGHPDQDNAHLARSRFFSCGDLCGNLVLPFAEDVPDRHCPQKRGNLIMITDFDHHQAQTQ